MSNITGKADQSNSPKPKKRLSLGTALKQARKAGHCVMGAAIYADRIELRFDEHGFRAPAVTPLEQWREKRNARQT
jgi:hypothetical protein